MGREVRSPCNHVGLTPTEFDAVPNNQIGIHWTEGLVVSLRRDSWRQNDLPPARRGLEINTDGESYIRPTHLLYAIRVRERFPFLNGYGLEIVSGIASMERRIKSMA